MLLSLPLPSLAQREPVLKQIDLPHPYYFREMYLPQLTTGPSSAAWMPDSETLVYSMAGDLWKQKLGLNEAQQITAGAGYDYQPDVSHDGKWVVYTCYLKDAMELWVLDLSNGKTQQLTSGGAVNVEPRFSPDGKRIAFVSTSYHGHFHIFVGDFGDGKLKNVQRLTGKPAAICRVITTASSIMRLVRYGRQMAKRFFTCQIEGIFTGPAASGA